MNDLYYFEEIGFDSKWKPKTSIFKPVNVKPDGVKIRIRTVVLIADIHKNLNLTALQEIYGA